MKILKAFLLAVVYVAIFISVIPAIFVYLAYVGNSVYHGSSTEGLISFIPAVIVLLTLVTISCYSYIE